MRKRYWIIEFLLAAVVFVGGMYVYSEYEQAESIKQSKVQVELAGVEVVKSALNIYYTFYGDYPVNTDMLIERLSDKRNYEILNVKPYDTIKFKKIMEELKDFEYSVRGDHKAYKFTYTDQYGDKKIIEREYQKDFH